MLCTNAKGILHETLQQPEIKKLDIDLQTIDIMKEENSSWFDVYCYDVPVLHIDHINQKRPIKFMHYFHIDKLTEELLRDEPTDTNF